MVRCLVKKHRDFTLLSYSGDTKLQPTTKRDLPEVIRSNQNSLTYLPFIKKKKKKNTGPQITMLYPRVFCVPPLPVSNKLTDLP
jgi:hypothetical protein